MNISFCVSELPSPIFFKIILGYGIIALNKLFDQEVRAMRGLVFVRPGGHGIMESFIAEEDTQP